MKRNYWLVICLLPLLLGGCNLPAVEAEAENLLLAEFTESYVSVSILLEHSGEEDGVLMATFTPTETDAHLYSMELPLEGIDGLGRPTLLALAPGAFMQVAGELQESQPSEEQVVAPDLPALPVYPAGAVTLRLPILLPEGEGELIADQVLVTYMSCTPRGCHKPVVERLVDVRVPCK